jgi:hypothetical protein
MGLPAFVSDIFESRGAFNAYRSHGVALVDRHEIQLPVLRRRPTESQSVAGAGLNHSGDPSRRCGLQHVV